MQINLRPWITKPGEVEQPAQLPDLKERLVLEGFDIDNSPAEALQRVLRRDVAKWVKGGIGVPETLQHAIPDDSTRGGPSIYDLPAKSRPSPVQAQVSVAKLPEYSVVCPGLRCHRQSVTMSLVSVLLIGHLPALVVEIARSHCLR